MGTREISARRLAALVATALFASTLLLYAPVRRLPFVTLDDDLYVTENPHVRPGLTVEGAAWALTSVGYAGNWHPAAWLSHMLDVEIFGLDPAGHHLVSAGLHAANAAVLFLVLRSLTGRLWMCACAAALFAVHPLRVESVAWVAERKDVLSSFFGLLAIGAWTRYVRRPGPARYCGAAALLALGLTAKPMLVTIPALLLLLEWWPLGRWDGVGSPGRTVLARLLAEKLPLAALAAATAALTLAAQQREGAVVPLEEGGLAPRLAGALIAYARYVGKLLWPADLAITYGSPSTRPAAWAVAAAVTLLLGACGAAALLRRRAPWIGVGACWYLTAMLPVIGIVRVGHESGADRYTYLPLVGIVLAAAISAEQLARGAGAALRRGLTVGVCLLVLALGWLTRLQIATWGGTEALFERARRLVPDAHWIDSVGAFNLAVELARQGRTDEAKQRFRALMAAAPGYGAPRNNLAGLLLQEGLATEAETLLREGLRQSPRDVKMLDNLGVALGMQGRYPEALEQFHRALAVDPRDEFAHGNISETWQRLGDDARAAAALREAVRCNPGNRELAKRLADIERRAGAPGR